MTTPWAEIIIEMSSVLNVSNDSSKSKEFNLNDIEVLVDSEEQNSFKRSHVGKFLASYILIRQWGAWISLWGHACHYKISKRLV